MSSFWVTTLLNRQLFLLCFFVVLCFVSLDDDVSILPRVIVLLLAVACG